MQSIDFFPLNFLKLTEKIDLFEENDYLLYIGRLAFIYYTYLQSCYMTCQLAFPQLIDMAMSLSRSCQRLLLRYTSRTVSKGKGCSDK